MSPTVHRSTPIPVPQAGAPNLVLERKTIEPHTYEWARLTDTKPVLFTGRVCRHEVGPEGRCEPCSKLALGSLQDMVKVRNLGAAP